MIEHKLLATLFLAASAVPACAQTILAATDSVGKAANVSAEDAVVRAAQRALAQAELLQKLLAEHRALHAAQVPGWPCHDSSSAAARRLRAVSQGLRL